MKKLGLLVIASVLLVACSSIKIVTGYNKTVDFTKFKTLTYYGWSDNSDKILNSINKEQIEKLFAKEFVNRGITITKGESDIIVSLYVVTQTKKEASVSTDHHTGMYGGVHGGYGGYYGYGPGYGWGNGYSSSSYTEHEYTVGTLIISVSDAKNKKLIWECTSTGTIEENPRNLDKQIAKSVAKMMATYPVKKQKK